MADPAHHPGAAPPSTAVLVREAPPLCCSATESPPAWPPSSPVPPPPAPPHSPLPSQTPSSALSGSTAQSGQVTAGAPSIRGAKTGLSWQQKKQAQELWEPKGPVPPDSGWAPREGVRRQLGRGRPRHLGEYCENQGSLQEPDPHLGEGRAGEFPEGLQEGGLAGGEAGALKEKTEVRGGGSSQLCPCRPALVAKVSGRGVELVRQPKGSPKSG